MKVDVRRWQAPVEVKVAASLLVGIALVHVLLGAVIVLTSDGSPRTLALPLTSLVFGALVAAGIAARNGFARIAGFVVVVLFATVHAFTLMAGAFLWFKIFGGLAAAGYVYAGVLLNSMPLRRYVLGEKA
jgi:hypothetical protein